MPNFRTILLFLLLYCSTTLWQLSTPMSMHDIPYVIAPMSSHSNNCKNSTSTLLQHHLCLNVVATPLLPQHCSNTIYALMLLQHHLYLNIATTIFHHWYLRWGVGMRYATSICCFGGRRKVIGIPQGTRQFFFARVKWTWYMLLPIWHSWWAWHSCNKL